MAMLRWMGWALAAGSAALFLLVVGWVAVATVRYEWRRWRLKRALRAVSRVTPADEQDALEELAFWVEDGPRRPS